MADERKHYSYEVYAREETARSFESQRFGGPIGSYLRERQQQHLIDWLGELAGMKVLDVGAGTGRAAIPLSVAGARVVAADASEAMLAEARRKAEAAGAELAFERCDAMALPFGDRAFDTVLCLRVLLHVRDWRLALAEACRCAACTLVLDFPPRWSLASLQMPVRAVASLFRPAVQRFRLFSLRQIRRLLARHGFAVRRVDRLWVLPIALHKLIGSRRITLAAERFLAWFGLRRLFGAPVTVLAHREAEGVEGEQ